MIAARALRQGCLSPGLVQWTDQLTCTFSDTFHSSPWLPLIPSGSSFSLGYCISISLMTGSEMLSFSSGSPISPPWISISDASQAGKHLNWDRASTVVPGCLWLSHASIKPLLFSPLIQHTLWSSILLANVPATLGTLVHISRAGFELGSTRKDPLAVELMLYEFPTDISTPNFTNYRWQDI